MAQVAKPTTGGGVNGGKFQDKDKPMEVRMSNITAAKGNGHRHTQHTSNAFRVLNHFMYSCWRRDPYFIRSQRHG